MKKYIVALIMASLCGATDNQASAQRITMTKNDSIANVIKLKTLQTKRESLLQKIEMEDKKRNIQTNGVTPERQEELNNRQDSVCLSLRSQLVDVILEIKEMAPNVVTPQLMQQYNNLLNKKEDEPTAGKAEKQPAKQTTSKNN